MLGYKDVPKDIRKNLEFRSSILEGCHGLGLSGRGEIIRLCAVDILFWINVFGYTYDPRRAPGDRVIPFVTWDFQDEMILAVQGAVLGGRNLLIEKSRDMGATWGCLYVMDHFAQFHRDNAFGVISRVEELVDRAGNDPDTLFWKLDFILEKQPKWMVPEVERRRRHIGFPGMNSAIDGYGATGSVMRGGRKTAVFWDELAAWDEAEAQSANAATSAVTECRVMNSTYKGTTGLFYEQSRRPDLEKVSLHWTKHPKKREGLYYDALGKPHSPYYDRKCAELIVQGLIAAELDMDPAGSASMYFPGEMVDRLIRESAMVPFQTGRLEQDMPGRVLGFLDDEKGDLWLWLYLSEGRPPRSYYGIGCDISAGTGATNSVASVVDLRTGEKVGELATPCLSPYRFADQVVALARWFHEAKVIWEMNGPGGEFGARLIDLGYRNIYYRRNEQSLARRDSDVPGWFASPENTRALLANYVSLLGNGKFVNRSQEALRECRQYVYLPKTGEIGNARLKSVCDPSGARSNHGDRVMADALAAKWLTEPDVPAGPLPDLILPGSIAWLRQQEEKRERESSGAW